MLIIPIIAMAACNPYGSAVNKAFAKPLEKKYRQVERTADRNYAYIPYTIHCTVSEEDSLFFFNDPYYYTMVEIKGANIYAYTNMEGECTLTFHDSLFVKNLVYLEASDSWGQQALQEVRKKDFKGNETHVQIVLKRPEIYLD